MSLRKPALVAAAVLTISLGSGICRAQANNAMLAEALFEEGQKLMDAGKIKEACEKFASSQKLDPATGTLLNLAACHEKQGVVATSWLEFNEALAQASRAGDKGRIQFAKGHIAALEKQLHRVVIEVLKPHKLMTVKLDGQDLPKDALGTAIPLDPGEHKIEVYQPGKELWKRTVQAGTSAGTDRIEVPELEDKHYDIPQAKVDDVPKQEDKPKETTVDTGGGGGANVMLITGLATAGVGVAGVVIGSVFGVMALGAASDRDKICKPGAPCRDQRAFDFDFTAHQDQTMLFVIGGIGAAALIGGGVMIGIGLASKKPAATTGLVVRPALGPGIAGLSLGGTFQ
jgi:hypothetical protein